MLREWTYTASSRDALGNTSLLSAVKGYIIIIFTIKYCLSCLQLFTSLHHCHHHKHPHQRHHHRLIPTYCFILIIIIRMINWSSSFNHIIIPAEQARPDDWSVWYLWIVQKISNFLIHLQSKKFLKNTFEWYKRYPTFSNIFK